MPVILASRIPDVDNIRIIEIYQRYVWRDQRVRALG